MRCLVYTGPWSVELRETAPPVLEAPDDVLIELRAVGICGTDLGILSGEYPAVRPPVVLGHEAAGVVHAVGPAAADLQPGDRVVIDPTYACLHCRMCTTGRPNHCLRKDGTECGVSADGMFRGLHRTQRRFVHRLPNHLDFTAAALTEPLSCTLTGVQQLTLRTDHVAAVVGGGPMGLLYAHALAVRGLRGTLVEISAPRRELAAKALPAGWRCTEGLADALTGTPAEETGLDIVVDTSGHAAKQALDLLARGGQLLAVGLGGPAISVDPAVFADQSKRLVGSIDSLDGSFAAALDLLATGRVPAEHIVTHTFGLDDHAEAFALLGVELAARRRTPPGAALKAVLVP